VRFKKYVYLGFISFVLFLGLNVYQSRKSVDRMHALRAIPKEERDSLEWLLRHFHQDSSYVLFGTKPMAFAFLKREEVFRAQAPGVYEVMDSITQYHIHNFVGLKGWEAWEKYKHLFASSNFVLLQNSEPNLNTLYLINKREFLKTVEEEIDLFKKVLGSHITPQKVLDQCLTSKDVFEIALKGNHALLGVLLGFGRHNAELFARRNEIMHKKALMPSSGFATLEEEYAYLDAKLQSFTEEESEEWNSLGLTLPCFAADLDHPETQKLKMKYRKQFKEIVQKYKGADFLEVTLRQFAFNTSTS